MLAEVRTLTCLSRVCVFGQEDERDAMHRHQALPGHHDSFWVSTLLSVPPASVLHDRKNGEQRKMETTRKTTQRPTDVCNTSKRKAFWRKKQPHFRKPDRKRGSNPDMSLLCGVCISAQNLRFKSKYQINAAYLCPS